MNLEDGETSHREKKAIEYLRTAIGSQIILNSESKDLIQKKVSWEEDSEKNSDENKTNAIKKVLGEGTSETATKKQKMALTSN